MLLPLAAGLLSQSVNPVVGQEVEQPFHLTIIPVRLPELKPQPVGLLNEFWNGKDEVISCV